MRQKISKKTKSWTEFENITKVGLEAIGYKVERDVLIAGSQIDLYAEKVEPLQTHRIIVECKEYSKPVGISIVRNFFAIVQAISTQGQQISGIFVTSTGYTNAAHQFAREAGLKLLTIQELLNYSFDPSEIVTFITEKYLNSGLCELYVDLSCQVTEIRGCTIYKPAEKFFDQFFSQTNRPGIALLGNFGSGKTSLSLHYSYVLAQRWLEEEEAKRFLPIYVNLRDFDDFMQFERQLFNFLKDTYRADITVHGLKCWIHNKETIFILDGFDEMAAKMSKREINRNISSLINYCNGTKAKLILSCRTHFLKSQVEEKMLGTILKLYLCNWGEEEVIQYAIKANPENASKLLTTIRQTYNLEELSKTPIFLNMIIESIDEIGGKVSKSKLYEVYTDRWIYSQDYRSKLAAEDKLAFMEELAFEMFINGEGKIEYSTLPTRLQEYFSFRDYEFIVAVDKDIRTCSFLVRDQEGLYYFVHKSYMEFFVAKKLAQEVKSNNFESISAFSFTPEVASFFAEYFEKEKDIILRGLLRNSLDQYRANCALTIGCFGYSEDRFKALSLCINTDDSKTVKYFAMDSLSKWNEEEVICFLITVVKYNQELSNIALRALGPHIERTCVLDLFIGILSTKDINESQVVIALESLEDYEVEEVEDAIYLLIKGIDIYESETLVKSLIKAIANRKNLRLVLELGRIENKLGMQICETDKRDIIGLLNVAKTESTPLFLANIKDDARENKRAGLNYSQNEGNLRKKYQFLISEKSISHMLDPLYGVIAFDLGV